MKAAITITTAAILTQAIMSCIITPPEHAQTEMHKNASLQSNGIMSEDHKPTWLWIYEMILRKFVIIP